MNQQAHKKVEQSPAEQTMIEKFNIQEITKVNIDLMKKQILEIPECPENKEQYDKVYRYHVDSKSLLPKIEDRRAELKAPVLKKGKDIDSTAKKAKEMIQPLIDLSGDRRFAWEKIAEDKKAAEAKIERDRLGLIQWHMDGLIADCEPLPYGMTAQQISGEIRFLKKVDVSAVDFGDRFEEANEKLEEAKHFALDAYESALDWESKQKAAAELAAVAL